MSTAASVAGPYAEAVPGCQLSTELLSQATPCVGAY